MVDSEVIQRKDSGNKGHGSYHKNSQMSWIAAFFWNLNIAAVTRLLWRLMEFYLQDRGSHSRLPSDDESSWFWWDCPDSDERHSKQTKPPSPSSIRSQPLLLCIQLGFTVNTCTISLTKLIVLNEVFVWKTLIDTNDPLSQHSTKK